uniref:Putative secreted protein n=1 Tax=Anopheles marajoara TaxID=58244 RepID=A0A2M4CCN0_9DIPT
MRVVSASLAAHTTMAILLLVPPNALAELDGWEGCEFRWRAEEHAARPLARGHHTTATWCCTYHKTVHRPPPIGVL